MTTTFDDRERAFEKKFALDQEARFKVSVRRNRLLGLWAAERLGIPKEEADAYASAVIKADFEEPGDGDVIRKLLEDFAAKNIAMTEAQIREVMTQFAAEAIKQFDAQAKTYPGGRG